MMRDSGKRKRLAAAGRDLVHRFCAPDTVAAAMLEVYRNAWLGANEVPVA